MFSSAAFPATTTTFRGIVSSGSDDNNASMPELPVTFPSSVSRSSEVMRNCRARPEVDPLPLLRCTCTVLRSRE